MCLGNREEPASLGLSEERPCVTTPEDHLQESRATGPQPVSQAGSD